MRVLHLGKYYAPQRGGIERHVQDLAEWQVAHGLDVDVLVHQPATRWRSTQETLAGVRVRRVGCVAAPLYTPLCPAMPLQLAKFLADGQTDVLHLHMPNPSCFFALTSARARRVPWIVHWHADVPSDSPDWRMRAAYRAYRPFEHALLARAHTIIATSARYLDASAALAPWRAKVRVIALGIDAQADLHGSAPAWPVTTGMRVLAVGRLSHYKGFATLLAALAQVPTACLLLIGNGEESAGLRRLADAHGVSDRVAFVGEVDDASLQAAYAAADVFVLPSLERSEAFGLVLLEAMRAGRAVIASDIAGSGVGHVVAGQETGLLVPPGEIDALAQALHRLHDEPDLRSRLGKAGRERWQAAFTLQRSARSVLDLYLRALD